MIETFHPFGGFPWDIREQIWKCAIRPTPHGAHFFSIAGNPKDYRTADEITDAFVFSDAYHPSLIMSAPASMTRRVDDDGFKGTEQVPASWFVNNTSTYISDSGLWTACKESRWVIQKHFRLQEWGETRSTVGDFKKMPELVHFRDQDSKDYYSTVFPYQDLFIFQANDWNLDWAGMKTDIMGLRNADYSGLKNIAIEFNQEWGIQTNRFGPESVKVLLPLAFMAKDPDNERGIKNFWLIGYRIKRRAHVPTEEEAALPAPKVFY
ncbi:hypothetical protein FSARC_1591 [Fusarium sarcochroum]|uniref:2EXR domain-containing protein n=1 Tax=Fusarium sarcochroum TaxID=1208366 RepID=A0A8H4XEZ6_9HYPO|nr:hypothetical protein FSARC_1591 [Fusarium sarcochroum]